MGQVQAAVRHQQKVQALCAGLIRALCAQPELHFRGRRLHRGKHLLPLFAPHLHPSIEKDDFLSFRGAADGLALRLACSDHALHLRLQPQAPVERLLFDLFEQIRAEAMIPAGMPGVTSNLRHRHEQWVLTYLHSGLAESARGILLLTVAQICRSRVTGEPVVESSEDLMEATRAGIAPLIGHDVAGLRKHRHDQAAYAVHALSIAHLIAGLTHFENDPFDAESVQHQAKDSEHAAFTMMMNFDATVQEGLGSGVTEQSMALPSPSGQYKIFSTAYDREIVAAALVRPAQLREYREQLDKRITAQGINVPRLSRQLKAILADPMTDGWDSNQEEGRIDGSKLARLIASPTERRLFRTEQLNLNADCTVTFLIDCSGSMREHAESVAVLVDVFARALELAGAQSEVLGFTTGAWNGGQTQRDWQRLGQPAHPGRLNEVSHLIFKTAPTPWRRARSTLAALLKSDLFREGIDGEAVDWACRRLEACEARRKLLIVISDGCPMDRATQLANDAQYLDNHLKEVTLRHEQAGRIEIFGVGVGLDLSPYYAISHALDLSSAPDNSMFQELLGMLARVGPK